ncbi:MAG: MGH1-like glycoside hydrolase domain-containing protein [Pyrinomonadaceae bacterium]
MEKLLRAMILLAIPVALTGCVAHDNRAHSPTKEVAELCARESHLNDSAASAPTESNMSDTSRLTLPQQVAVNRPIDNQYSRQTAYSSCDDSLDRLQDFFLPTLAANAKQFSGRQGVVKGFGAGRVYPQIWLRDSATIIPASRFYYPAEYLTTWLEEHLSYQGDDGRLNDWIASGGTANFLPGAPKVKEVYRAGADTGGGDTITISADKNTTEADQETSAVDAAYQVFKLTGDRDWLNKNIRGTTLLKRLDLALEYLLKARFDDKHGLVKNAFTADWGDVSPTYPDQRAIYWDEKTPLVAGLYTNVLFYRAAEQLQEMYAALAQTRKADYWKAKATAVKANINKNLWQEDKGFYRIHLLLTSPGGKDWEDDSNIFAAGGNGLAALYAVADDEQARRIFEVAEQRQRAGGLSTVAGVLSPPYPRGFFKHPAVNEEYNYQNGGQWDWFAGRFLLAEFERGYSARAYRQLIEIGGKAVGNNGLYEWHTRDGQGKGSSDYAGSAGALSAAVFQGLYGVYLSGGMLNLKIRLSDRPGQIHVYQPATDNYVAYRYGYDEVSQTASMVYESNIPGAGELCVLLPQHRRLEELKVDGQKKTFTSETTGEDTYGCFPTDWKTHRMEFKTADSPPGH